MSEGYLTEQQTKKYWDDGYLFPVDVLSQEQVTSYIDELNRIETQYKNNPDLDRELTDYFRTNANVVMKMIADMAMNENMVNAISSLLGEDVLLWSADIIIKEAHTEKMISWHQDLTYWGFEANEKTVSAWLALTPAYAENGSMRFVKASHKLGQVTHKDTFAEDNLLSRGQELQAEINEDDIVVSALKPGQMSLHHGYSFHASSPNRTDDRRVGIAFRYITPDLEKIHSKDYAMLVRGADRYNNYTLVAPPQSNFSDHSIRLYDEITQAHLIYLAAQSDKPINYGNGEWIQK